jgi:MoaA/NifB/PqqE/SkfB family radical SAM enzyme
VRVVVIHPPLSVAPDFVDHPYAADLGAVQLAGALRGAADVRLVDAFALAGATVARGAGGRLRLGAPAAEVLARVRATGAADAAIVALTPFHRPPARDRDLAEVCAGVRAALPPGAPLWLADCYQSGQHYLEADPAAVLASYPEVDAWVKYEAEATVPALLAEVAAGRCPAGSFAGAEADLARLAEPAWDLVDLPARDRFAARVVAGLGRGAWPFPIDGRTLPVVTSRGCPFRCLHCSSNPGLAPGARKTQRRLPPEHVAARFRSLVERHGATRLFLLDELVNANAEHLDAVLDACEALGVRLEIPNGLRADLLPDRHVRRLAARATTLSVSAESGVQRVVDEVVGKRLDLREVERVAATSRDVGVPLLVHFMIGLPGETPAEVNATLAFAAGLRERFGAAPAVQYATPLPGTPLATLVRAAPADDWGPAFRARPSATNDAVPPDALARFRWALERRLSGSGTEKLVLNLTYRCNNRCAFCAVGNRVRRDGDPRSQHALLERYRAAGVRLVDLDGGEPTLHAELFPLVAHAARLGYERIAVTTNGRRCSYPAYARRLATSGVTTVLVSLHGPDPATHGGLVGVPEAFEQTVAGIRNLVAAAPAGLELGVNATVTRANVERLDALAALVASLGIRWMNLQFLTPFGRATREHAPDPGVAAARARAVVEAWRARMKLMLVNVPLCALPGHEDLVAPDLGKAGRSMVFVDDEEVNLAAYLAARRVRRPECEPCPYAVCCAGFYELEDAPEPPWTGRAPAGTGTSSPSP